MIPPMHTNVGNNTKQEASSLGSYSKDLARNIAGRSAKVGVCGLGYVGLPLARAIFASGFPVLAFDVDRAKIDLLKAGKSYIHHISAEQLAPMVNSDRFEPTDQFSRISEADIIVICVPTPLNKHREPDLTYVVSTVETIAQYAKKGQLVILESTTYPGTTIDVVIPALEAKGFSSGQDLFVAFSPEREDPGNLNFETVTIPKVVGGHGKAALDLASAFYSSFIKRVVPVSSPSAAEAVKLTENIFRAVNIALVNELKTIFSKMGIDVWEVIEAAKTKPFGFMPFYPGPGLGGHCIPIDPFYLTWKAREFDISTKFIELAGEINSRMPDYVVDCLAVELDRRFCKGVNGSKILVAGLAYKKNVDDMRESPALKIIDLLEARGAKVDYADTYIPQIQSSRDHPEFAGRTAVALESKTIASFDAVVIVTDHDNFDYRLLVEHARLIIDSRNACARHGLISDKIAKA
jgi:UDP-N-acetyl-D-glucosamine dehydrogenase